MSGNSNKRMRSRAWSLGAVAACAAARLLAAELEISRSFDRFVTLTNRPIRVTVTVSNATGQTLRGLWFSDQVPAGLTVTPLSVSLAGSPVTNHLHEVGQEADVYPGCVPHRWVLERPRAFAENNPVPPGANVEIRYELVAETPGVFVLPEFGVVGYNPVTSNALFSISAENQTVVARFLTLANRFAALGEWTANGFRVATDAPTGWCFAVEVTTNFTAWSPLASNIAPNAVLDTNATTQPARFYRLVWLP